jgi:hypothetical protein
MELIEAVFRNSWAERNASASKSFALRQELGKLEARERRVLVQMADGVLSEEDFASLPKGTTTAMADIRARIDRVESSELDLKTALDYLCHLALEHLSHLANQRFTKKAEDSAENLSDGCRIRQNGL